MLSKQAEQKMFRSYIIMIQIPGFFDRVFNDLLGPGGLGQLSHGDHIWAAFDEFFDFESDFAEVDVEILQDVSADAAAFLDETEKDVLGADVLVVKALGFLVGQSHDLRARSVK